MEDIVIVESKDYAQVLFEDIHECYSENKDLICSFTLNEFLEIDKNDFIGVYKVGFTKPKDSLVYMNIDLNDINEENKGKLVFTAEKLPKDDGEFYQFIYMSMGKHIRGASIPFQFKRTHISDYVEVDEQDGVVLKLKESEINDTLSEIKQKCSNLTQANETYERLVKENDDSIRMLKDELTNFKMRCLRLTMENEKLSYTLQSKCENFKTINDTLNSLSDENHKLKEKFDYLSNENKNLVDLLQRRINQVESLKHDLEGVRMNKDEIEIMLNAKEAELTQLRKEKEELKSVSSNLQKNTENVSKLEKQVDEHVDELNKIKADLKRNEAMVCEQTQTIQTILTERDSLNTLIENLTKEKSDLEVARDTISQELLMSKDKLMAVEQCKELLRAQLAISSSELESAHGKIRDSSEELMRLTEKEKVQEYEKIEMIERMNKMKDEYENRLEQANGAYFALNLAHMHLENRMKMNLNRYEKESVENKDLLDTLKTENENLKQRIRAGACEYALLNNKYLKLRNAFRLSKSVSSSCIFSNNNLNKYEEIDSVLHDRTMSENGQSPMVNEFDTTVIDDMSLRSSFYSLTKISPQPEQEQAEQRQHEREQDEKKSHGESKIMSKRDMMSASISSTISSTPFRPISCDLSKLKITDSQLNSQYSLTQSDDLNNNTAASTLMRNDETIENNMSTECGDCHDNKKSIQNGTCEICGYIFPTDLDVFAYEMHVSSHYGPSCPVCFFTFRKGYPQSDFESHVNSHFTN